MLQSPTNGSAIRTAMILDTPLSITNYRRLSRFCFMQKRGSGGAVTINFTDLNVLFLRKNDPHFKETTDRAVDFFVPDGVSLKLLLAKKGIPFDGHITASRFMRHCCLRSPENVRHFVLGGTPESVARLVAALQSHNPKLQIAGSHAGGFSADEEETVVEKINRAQPNILWSCLPTPQQESFAWRWKLRLVSEVNLLVGVGFDFEEALAEVEKAGRRLTPLRMRRIWHFSLRAVPRLVRSPAFVWRLRKLLPELRADPRSSSLAWWASGSELIWFFKRRLPAFFACARHRARAWGRRAAKRGLDILASSLLILLAAPVLVLTALTVFLVDGRPILFPQTRVGKSGRIFKIWKFRTMRRDAELIAGKAHAHKIEKDEHFFHDPDNEQIIRLRKVLLQHSRSTKYPRDPRIIPLGRLIRRFSLDELPQLFHVLSGKLSLVGPRPFVRSEVSEYGPRHVLRHSVKPGLTGPWQVSDRNALNFEESIELDLQYIRHQSLVLDLKILLRTIPAAFRNRGGE